MSGSNIPQHLDEPERMILFTLDEFIVICMISVSGLLIDKLLEGIVAAFLFYYFYLKLKAGFSPSYFKRKIYWYFPSSMLQLKRSPDSLIREFIG